jgi:hypothetical protein
MKVGAADGRGAFFALRTAFILSKLDTYRIKYFDEVLMTLGELLRHDNASNRILVDGSALVTYTARGAGTCDACGCPYAIGDAIIGRHVRLDMAIWIWKWTPSCAPAAPRATSGASTAILAAPGRAIRGRAGQPTPRRGRSGAVPARSSRGLRRAGPGAARSWRGPATPERPLPHVVP